MFASLSVDQSKAQSLADAIADFRDPDNLVRPQGAEEKEYRIAGLGWGPKNASFDGVEELQQVLGMTPEIYARISPHLTTYLLDVGFLFNEPPSTYSIRAEANGPNGANYVSEAVVQLIGDSPMILSWQQAMR